VHGHFRSRGRNSEATVRGTKWSMTDTCAGTLTTVTRGSVLVRDFGLKKNKIVKAGHTYFARAGTRRKR
jgi:ferric-dicitrate binding protein FerR (iron transport regulator)